MLKIYNSLTRQKEQFIPLNPAKVGMYVCGLTVYDYYHLGHARTYVSFDIVVRYLRAQGYDVTYVRNITDIDDKIIKRALEQQQAMPELTEFFIKAMHEDEQALGLLKPDHEPRATTHIVQIIQLIERLIAKEFAYVGDNGDVFFDVNKFKEYGKLSHKDLAGQEAGARVEVVSAKRNALDFVLWKQAKPDEPSWSSPWGEGRPGWHIECSAMAMDCLTETFDIHGGGFDLQFPHHENEIAQSEAASGKPFAKWWMHVGFLQINQEKMSKSLGNFFTLREVLAKFNPETVRYFLLSSHYRSQLNYSEENLVQAHNSLVRFYQTLRGLPPLPSAAMVEEWQQRFKQAMDDDFNTPDALAVLFDLTHEINRSRDHGDREATLKLAATLQQLSAILGILQQDPDSFMQAGVAKLAVAEIEDLITKRNHARQNKNWQLADEIRNNLLDKGISLEDKGDETIWKRSGEIKE